MNALEKYAAKKKLTKKLLEGLYGKKPRSAEDQLLIGQLLGTAGGGGGARALFGRDAYWAGGVPLALGGYAGVLGGGLAGAAAGIHSNKAYRARRALVNKRLKMGTVGAGGLAALAAILKKENK
mgnify:CR=1 FL=1